MNKIQNIVDYYLLITKKPESEYKKHLRAAKELLILCDDDVERAKGVLNCCQRKAVGEWSIYWAVKQWACIPQ